VELLPRLRHWELTVHEKFVMTIKRGQTWGERGLPPDHLPVATSDSAAASLLDAGCREFIIAGGDMWRTVGGSASFDSSTAKFSDEEFSKNPPLPSQERTIVLLDALEASFVLGQTRQQRWIFSHAVFTAHLNFFRRLGSVFSHADETYVMNAQFLGPWDVAPRSHPNDGRFEIMTVPGVLPWRQRRQFRRRLLTGTHVPHPQIELRSSTQTWNAVSPGSVILDGVPIGVVSELSITIVPDSITVWI